jgi:hypothetical protein
VPSLTRCARWPREPAVYAATAHDWATWDAKARPLCRPRAQAARDEKRARAQFGDGFHKVRKRRFRTAPDKHAACRVETHGLTDSRTLLREAEEALGRARDPNEVMDMLRIIEESATHFFLRAKMGKNTGRNQSEVDADYEKAAHLAALAAPYRHAKLSAVKLAGDPNNPMRIKDDATADEIRAELMRHLVILIDGRLQGRRAPHGLIDLEALQQVQALSAPHRGIANQPNG